MIYSRQHGQNLAPRMAIVVQAMIGGGVSGNYEYFEVNLLLFQESCLQMIRRVVIPITSFLIYLMDVAKQLSADRYAYFRVRKTRLCCTNILSRQL